MIQVIFFALLIVSLLAGYITYFNPPSPPNPVKFVMDQSGLTAQETTNRKEAQEILLTTNKGMIQIRQLMDDLSVKQSKLNDMIARQQQYLRDMGRDANNLIASAQKHGRGSDVLQLKALAQEMQDQQRLLIDGGQNLLVLNDQVSNNRKWVAQQIDLGNYTTQTSLGALQQHYSSLQIQESGFLDKVNAYNQKVRDAMAKMQDKLENVVNKDMCGNPTDQQSSDCLKQQQNLDKQRLTLDRLAASQQKNNEFLEQARDKLARAKDLARDLSQDVGQNTHDLVDDERQKQQDQQDSLRQKLADERQRMQDKLNR